MPGETPRRAPDPALFPPAVVQHSVSFHPDDLSDLAQQFPGVRLPEALARAVRKRQAEFLAGRFCAKEALKICAPAYAEVPIEWGVHREPLWPPGIVGAITHTAGFASVAVARRSDARGVGIDAEQIMSAEQVARVQDTIASAEELAALERATRWPRAVVLTLVFSAKETIFKALYPEVRRYFDFRDAFVETLDPGGRFSARLLATLTPTLEAGLRVHGRFDRNDTTVYTALLIAP